MTITNEITSGGGAGALSAAIVGSGGCKEGWKRDQTWRSGGGLGLNSVVCVVK